MVKKPRKSARAKGNDFQRWIRDWLLERGWTVHNFPVIARPRMTKKGLIYTPQKQDVWGADLVARKEQALLWIQATGKSNITERAGEFAKHFDHLLPGEQVQIWLKTGPGQVNIKSVRLLFIEKEGVTPKGLAAKDLGKIIKRNFFSLDGQPSPFGSLLFRLTKKKPRKEEKDAKMGTGLFGNA